MSSCINVLFNSVIGSLGNMAAMESKDYQYKVFEKYRFIGFWFYGFTSIALAILMTPFITIWIGKKMIVDEDDIKTELKKIIGRENEIRKALKKQKKYVEMYRKE